MLQIINNQTQEIRYRAFEISFRNRITQIFHNALNNVIPANQIVRDTHDAFNELYQNDFGIRFTIDHPVYVGRLLLANGIAHVILVAQVIDNALV